MYLHVIMVVIHTEICVNDQSWCFFCAVVFSQGDKGTSWYIIWKGSVNVITHGKVNPFSGCKNTEKSHSRHTLLPWNLMPASCNTESTVCTQGLVTTLHEGEDFGQLALLNDAPRAATIILREDNCHFLRVDKQDFIRILKVCYCCYAFKALCDRIVQIKSQI